jgi:glycerate kinase
VELASTSGIELLGDARRPWEASTLGFGQAIAAALDHGVSRLVLGIGSSASTDGGAGLLTALGARFTNDFGASIAPGAWAS